VPQPAAEDAPRPRAEVLQNIDGVFRVIEEERQRR